MNDFLTRVSDWNAREGRRHMAAVNRWADGLAQAGRKPLRKAHWWAGDPYGTRPATWKTWANRVAKKNPPTAFRATVTDPGLKLAFVKLGVQSAQVQVERGTT